MLVWEDEKCDDPNNFEYKKIQFEASTIEIEKNILDPHMMLMIGFDSQKQVHIVNSYMILEFLGDLGGFKEALNILILPISSYFSA